MLGSRQNPQDNHHKLKFYIFLATLVAGGFFVLFFLDDDNTSLTSSLIGYKENINDSLIGDDNAVNFENQKSSGAINNIASLSLIFDKVPKVENEVKIGDIELRFDDLTTTITVNEDKLELNNLKEVSLIIEGFSGKVNFEGDDLSIAGKAKKIEVNDVVFSSEKGIDISFKELNYNYLDISSIELDNLELERGNGKLTVGNKLSYSLEEEGIKISYFKGTIEINKDSKLSLLNLDGDARGVSISGNILNLNLK
ncbi:MAG: hypothetical protein ABH824_05550 [Nanoarchaeota archaeon]|nr:hypothetical protein [Nanoarchaeota archaeon]MBU1631730.1 hypothetical protein [Nanoarchaeota archaeon]MBU1875873.1 hypothetical protein [Nanoarchaeota archaeon]